VLGSRGQELRVGVSYPGFYSFNKARRRIDCSNTSSKWTSDVHGDHEDQDGRKGVKLTVVSILD